MEDTKLDEVKLSGSARNSIQAWLLEPFNKTANQGAPTISCDLKSKTGKRPLVKIKPTTQRPTSHKAESGFFFVESSYTFGLKPGELPAKNL